MKKTTVVLLLVLSMVLSGVQTVGAQSDDDMKALKQEIQELRKGQEEIKKDIQELKGLLQRTAKAAPPPQPKEAVVSIDDDPFKGEKTAKLTIIEFSDYQ